MFTFLSSRCRVLGVGVLAVALAGCAGSTGGARAEGAAAANAASSADSLAQTSWELVRWTRAGGALRDIPHGDNGEPIRLTFLAQGKQYRAEGFSGCNRYQGSYKLQGGKLAIDAPAATRMACVPAERAALEADYLRGLTVIDTFTLDSGGAPRHLTFNLRGGDVLEFERRQDPPTPERAPARCFSMFCGIRPQGGARLQWALPETAGKRAAAGGPCFLREISMSLSSAWRWIAPCALV